jgi:hypothetical protein
MMPEKCRVDHRVKTGVSAQREESREKFAGFSEDAIVEDGAVCGSFRADIESSGASGDLGNETSGGFDGAGSTDGQEHGALAERVENAVEIEGSFAKPADVRTNECAA